MMVELSFKVPLVKDSDEYLKKRICEILRIKRDLIKSVILLRRSIDARDKDRMIYVFYRVAVDLKEEIPIPSGIRRYRAPAGFRIKRCCKNLRVLVVGMGPAGLFSALALSEAGVRGIIVDRGCPVEERVKKVEELWSSGEIDENCNPQFGEGGAGTFSDGKLTTRVRDPRISWIFEKFVEFGAPDRILYEAKPHVGTDNIRKVVANIRRYLLDKGWQIAFNSRLEDLVLEGERLKRAVINGDALGVDALVLAPGNGARDTFKMLLNRGVALENKPFAVGFRIEHPQEFIDRIQYGRWAGHDRLPPATYQLAHTFRDLGRGVYTFCMCPGGYIICAASSRSRLVVNGMSYYARNSGYANSAVVVSVDGRDFGEEPLAGVRFQEDLEERAYAVAGNFVAPAQPVAEFMGYSRGRIEGCTYRPSVVHHDLWEVLPGHLAHLIKRGLGIFGKRMKGFDRCGVLVAVETRTSSPVRILRGETMESVSLEGLYPAGEGAGYAGGIVSSALDGIRVAEAIVEKYA